MKTLHTPAPWAITHYCPEEGEAFVIEAESRVVCWAANNYYDLEYTTAQKKRDKANANLIAAAPDLLAICEEIANDSKCDLVNSERRIRLYSALSKAKGERIK
jgi:hypothetical protein